MFDFIKKYYKQAVVTACGAVGGAALFVPALIPVAAVCAAVTPAILAGKPAIEILKGLLNGIGTSPSNPKKD